MVRIYNIGVIYPGTMSCGTIETHCALGVMQEFHDWLDGMPDWEFHDEDELYDWHYNDAYKYVTVHGWYRPGDQAVKDLVSVFGGACLGVSECDEGRHVKVAVSCSKLADMMAPAYWEWGDALQALAVNTSLRDFVCETDNYIELSTALRRAKNHPKCIPEAYFCGFGLDSSSAAGFFKYLVKHGQRRNRDVVELELIEHYEYHANGKN